LRALQPQEGLQLMRERRGLEAERLLCSGPGKLTQALGITLALNGRSIAEPPFLLRREDPAGAIVAGPRIGITKAVEQPWRFGLAASPFPSKRF
ncbi:DNA-3-methyladenine glycosylase, partial [Acinetobacter baumannii]|uniref:DNA-3-methyladenine glycosylase n=1 Tax=Acinetobacter baumannii TaxID=470 RepID=UPI002FDF14E6